MKFEEYCASFITPQMTLLEKFNALLKFLKEEKQFNVFFSSVKWQDNVEEYNVSDLHLGNYELKLDDVVVFTNGYYSYVKTLGNGKFTLGEIYFFVGEKGETGNGISSMSFNSQRHLIVNYTNGNIVDLGLIKGISSLTINNSNHLIVNFDNGTTQDLGDIFSGNVNINGNLTANSIIENMSGYSFAPVTKIGATINYTYAGVVKNGNKITFACSGFFERLDNLTGWNMPLCKFVIPSSIGQKLIETNVAGINALAFSTIYLAKSYATGISKPMIVVKSSNYEIQPQMYNLSDTELNTPYLFRFEITFLLSDSLVGE